MDVEQIRDYCLQKENTTESFPFGGETLVFKSSDKIFLLLALDAEELRFNVKCNPEKAIELREQYPEYVLPGYHMNKKHWNTIIPKYLKPLLVKEMINDSYNLVTQKNKRV